LAGWSAPPIFEGGASPLIRRIPKRGFHNAFAETVAAVNVRELEAAFRAGQVVSIEALREKDLVSGRFDQLKILGDGELTKKLKISAHRFSASALAKIQAAGGEAIELPRKQALVKGVAKKSAKKVAKKVAKPAKS
jgi:large subunit ribosomal protein L15